MKSTDPHSHHPPSKAPAGNNDEETEEEEEEVFPPLNEDGALTDEERLDESIAESFPASDPPSYSSGVDRHE